MSESPPEHIPDSRLYDVLSDLVDRAPDVSVDEFANIHLRDPHTESRIKISDRGTYLNLEEQLMHPIRSEGMEVVGMRSRVYRSPDLHGKTKVLLRYTGEQFDRLPEDLQRDPYHAGVMVPDHDREQTLLERTAEWRYSERTDELFPRVSKSDKIRQPGPVHG